MQTPSLSVVTPCSRPQNLLRIRPTIPEGSEWIIALDSENTDAVPDEIRNDPLIKLTALRQGSWGNSQRNAGLALATGDYVYFLDDDNVVHPGLQEVLATYGPEQLIVVGVQIYPDGDLRVLPKPPVGIGTVDTAQVLVPRHIAQAYRWDPDAYQADGIFFGEIFRDMPERFVFLEKTVCFYNFLVEPCVKR